MKDIILASNSTFNILTKYTFEQSARSFRAFFFANKFPHTIIIKLCRCLQEIHKATL